MNIHEAADDLVAQSKTLDYWRAVRTHPLNKVVPGLDVITQRQWRFWTDRRLIIQADLALGDAVLDVASGETQEKIVELERLSRGETTPLQVALEAADEIVFLDILVGMHPYDMGMWERVGVQAEAMAGAAIETIEHMRKLSQRRLEREAVSQLGDIPRFVADHVIGRKNASNYPAMYFVPAPLKKGSEGAATMVDTGDIVTIYDHARASARKVRTQVKEVGLYSSFGIPATVSQFARHNGNTPEPFRRDPAVVALQTSVSEHFRMYAHIFGRIGAAHLVNYFVRHDPSMVEVAMAALNTQSID